MKRAGLCFLQDDDEDYFGHNEYYVQPLGEKYRAGGLHAATAIKQHINNGTPLPGVLTPIANKWLRQDNGQIMPRQKVLKKFKQVVELVLTKTAKNYAQACEMVNAKPRWFYDTSKRYPGLQPFLEREYYRDLEEQAEKAKWQAKQKTIQAMADLAEKANERLSAVITDDEVAPAVHVSAVKQVHDVLGVVEKRGSGGRRASEWKPDDKDKALLAPLNDIVVDAEVIDGPTGSDVP